MRFAPDKCPTCGEDPAGIIEQVYGRAWLGERADDKFDYDGGTDMDWNSQEPARDEHDRVTLFCPARHTWQAGMMEN